ncbi:MAG: hypothetical protein FJZ92_11170 [Chloroflexi bacterium]|nr:hypothetical protein [Chloroflexota bacterium]
MRFSRLGFVFALIVALALLPAGFGLGGEAAGPPDEVPGLARAIEVQERHTPSLLARAGVVGTAVGDGADGSAEILVLTERGNVGGIPNRLDGVRVRVLVTGPASALAKPGGAEPEANACATTARCPRPVPIGVSTGHPAITAGTIGARVRDASGNVYALSNNHVYANTNAAQIGDAVIQPGTYDGGSSPADDIATLAAFVPIRFDGTANVAGVGEVASQRRAQPERAVPEGGLARGGAGKPLHRGAAAPARVQPDDRRRVGGGDRAPGVRARRARPGRRARDPGARRVLPRRGLLDRVARARGAGQGGRGGVGGSHRDRGRRAAR